ncbi:hypothetical protein HU200_048947 [Digitaria exilis]|uniref:Uncharacterized protein n=1 Tax=Digitaria exilis TaxID=1010633 RepID=A0A835E7F0_9POAL|nr:hypothetical protein HU200_048947 [Digitaria exilis]
MVTSSTMVIREVTGSHVLTIDGYSLSKGAEDGKYFSSTFTAAGDRWLLRYYPRSNSVSGWTAMYLQLAPSNASHVTARFTISLLDWNGQAVPSCTHAITRAHTFGPYGFDMAGFRKFIKRKNLKKSDHLRDDSFRVRVDITVLKGTTKITTTKNGGATTDVANLVDAAVTSAVVVPPPPPHEITVSKKEETKEEDGDALASIVVVPPPNMDRHLGHLLSSGEGADVTIEVDGEKFMAHRAILAARSPVFKGEFFGPMEEGTSPTRVQIKDMEASVFEVLLHFIYNDSLPPDVVDDGESEAISMAQHLLVAADRYGIERLKLMCEDKLYNYVGTSSVGTILALAEQHGCDGLKKACLKFLMSGSNLKAAIATDGFDHLAKSCPTVLKELLSKVAL